MRQRWREFRMQGRAGHRFSCSWWAPSWVLWRTFYLFLRVLETVNTNTVGMVRPAPSPQAGFTAASATAQAKRAPSHHRIHIHEPVRPACMKAKTPDWRQCGPRAPRWLLGVSAVALLLAGPFQAASGAAGTPPTGRIPVIFDSDIGDDIDDTWALGLLLQSPELDLKLVVGDYGKPQYAPGSSPSFSRLSAAAMSPSGWAFPSTPTATGPQAAWVQDYDLASYPAPVHTNGVQALIDTS